MFVRIYTVRIRRHLRRGILYLKTIIKPKNKYDNFFNNKLTKNVYENKTTSFCSYGIAARYDGL